MTVCPFLHHKTTFCGLSDDLPQLYKYVSKNAREQEEIYERNIQTNRHLLPVTDKDQSAKTLNKADSDKSENKEKISANLDKHAEEKTRLEQLREQKQQEYDSVIQQLEKQREAEKQAEKSGKKFTDYGKLLKIAMRIMNGDKVPMTDRKKLAEEMPDLYKQAILMRRLDNDKPRKYKSEYEDDKDKTTVEKCSTEWTAPTIPRTL